MSGHDDSSLSAWFRSKAAAVVTATVVTASSFLTSIGVSQPTGDCVMVEFEGGYGYGIGVKWAMIDGDLVALTKSNGLVYAIPAEEFRPNLRPSKAPRAETVRNSEIPYNSVPLNGLLTNTIPLNALSASVVANLGLPAGGVTTIENARGLARRVLFSWAQVGDRPAKLVKTAGLTFAIPSNWTPQTAPEPSRLKAIFRAIPSNSLSGSSPSIEFLKSALPASLLYEVGFAAGGYVPVEGLNGITYGVIHSWGKMPDGESAMFLNLNGLAYALPASAIPSNALPASAIPSNALPSSALPASALSSALPASAIPAEALPSAIPAEVLPASAIPAEAIPSNAIPSNALPASAIPSNALPASALFDLGFAAGGFMPIEGSDGFANYALVPDLSSDRDLAVLALDGNLLTFDLKSPAWVDAVGNNEASLNMGGNQLVAETGPDAFGAIGSSLTPTLDHVAFDSLTATSEAVAHQQILKHSLTSSGATQTASLSFTERRRLAREEEIRSLLQESPFASRDRESKIQLLTRAMEAHRLKEESPEYGSKCPFGVNVSQQSASDESEIAWTSWEREVHDSDGNSLVSRRGSILFPPGDRPDSVYESVSSDTRYVVSRDAVIVVSEQPLIDDGPGDNEGTGNGDNPGQEIGDLVPDDDNDGFRAAPDGPDCDDTDPSIHPNAFDVPDDGIDQDCDGVDSTSVDVGTPPAPDPPLNGGNPGQEIGDLVPDDDNDGFRAAPDGPDCDDTDPSIHPNAFDVPGDGIDQDCDGVDSTSVVSPPPIPPVNPPPPTPPSEVVNISSVEAYGPTTIGESMVYNGVEQCIGSSPSATEIDVWIDRLVDGSFVSSGPGDIASANLTWSVASTIGTTPMSYVQPDLWIANLGVFGPDTVASDTPITVTVYVTGNDGNTVSGSTQITLRDCVLPLEGG